MAKDIDNHDHDHDFIVVKEGLRGIESEAENPIAVPSISSQSPAGSPAVACATRSAGTLSQKPGDGKGHYTLHHLRALPELSTPRATNRNLQAAEMPISNVPSARKKAESSTTPVARGRQPTSNQSQSEPRQYAPATSQPSPHHSNRPPDEYISQFGQGLQTSKRKRESLQETSAYRPYISPYAPLDPPNRIASSLPNTPTISSTPNIIIPANIARDQTAYNNYIRERENQHGMASQQPKPVLSVPTFSAVNGNGNGNGFGSFPVITDTSRNKPATRGRDDTESVSPSAQLLDQPPLQSPSPEPATNSMRPTRMTTRNAQKKTSTNGLTATQNTQPNPSQVVDPPEPSLIDTFPRRKQKQIYGIIGGLQSGIRSCQQQAENMQKQLDLLQSALGIDLEDDKDVSMVR